MCFVPKIICAEVQISGPCQDVAVMFYRYLFEKGVIAKLLKDTAAHVSAEIDDSFFARRPRQANNMFFAVSLSGLDAIIREC